MGQSKLSFPSEKERKQTRHMKEEKNDRSRRHTEPSRICTEKHAPLVNGIRRNLASQGKRRDDGKGRKEGKRRDGWMMDGRIAVQGRLHGQANERDFSRRCLMSLSVRLQLFVRLTYLSVFVFVSLSALCLSFRLLSFACLSVCWFTKEVEEKQDRQTKFNSSSEKAIRFSLNLPIEATDGKKEKETTEKNGLACKEPQVRMATECTIDGLID
mmetsp:Transcript_26001/g.50980  ORF Transcript_26001/g.50980 Transcript_26001/m.50980 type:complete len:213 (-) Transcript_26001:82-720(-)